MRKPTRRVVFHAVLVACALPGLALVVRSFVTTSKREVADRVLRWEALAARAGGRFDVEMDLVLAVISAESSGDPAARSRVGALGLMQLLPPTARDVAEFLREPVPSDAELIDPAVNVTLGTAYLREQLDGFGGDVRLALAAYNAGPRRVREWQSAEPGVPAEEVLRRRAFAETRSYIDKVLEYRAILRERNAPR
ncbi:MAG: lytic transglycosylase domain-containing protein [Planctomycetes bacterium]|nr:lytic transglycosylase domain-containing protein [Planctomycetota bacterium]